MEAEKILESFNNILQESEKFEERFGDNILAFKASYDLKQKLEKQEKYSFNDKIASLVNMIFYKGNSDYHWLENGFIEDGEFVVNEEDSQISLKDSAFEKIFYDDSFRIAKIMINDLYIKYNDRLMLTKNKFIDKILNKVEKIACEKYNKEA